MKKVVLAAAVAATLTGQAFAEQTTGTASANLMETITFNETQAVDFGIVKNGVGQASNIQCRMTLDGSLTGDACIKTTGTPGTIEVTGTPNQMVLIQVMSDGTVDSVLYAPKLNNAVQTSLLQALDGTGKYTVNVVGFLTVEVGATAGLRELTYTLTANYQ